MPTSLATVAIDTFITELSGHGHGRGPGEGREVAVHAAEADASSVDRHVAGARLAPLVELAGDRSGSDGAEERGRPSIPSARRVPARRLGGHGVTGPGAVELVARSELGEPAVGQPAMRR